MTLVRLLLLVVLLVGIRPALADDPSASSGPLWELGVGVWTTSAVAFPGSMVLGGTVEGRRALTGPFFVSLRAAGGSASEANRHWQFLHRYAVLAGAAGARWQLGAARLWTQAGGGVMLVHEEVRRHQYQRLEAIGVDARVRDGWTLGPQLQAEAGVSLRLRGGFTAEFGGGPVFTRQNVAGEARNHLGWFSRVGVAHAF